MTLQLRPGYSAFSGFYGTSPPGSETLALQRLSGSVTDDATLSRNLCQGELGAGDVVWF